MEDSATRKQNIRAMRYLATALTLLTLLTGPTLAYTKQDICQQGQFAEMLADELFEDDPRVASEQGAIDTLSAHGIAPEGGWKAKEPLTRGAMAQVLSQVWASYLPSDPRRPVTIAEAEGAVNLHEDTTSDFLHWKRVHWQMLPLVQHHPDY